MRHRTFPDAKKKEKLVQGEENFLVGRISAPLNCGAWCTVAGTTVHGIHSGYTKKSFGITLGTQKHSLGYKGYARTILRMSTSIKTDPDKQHTGTSTSLQKKISADVPGSKE